MADLPLLLDRQPISLQDLHTEKKPVKLIAFIVFVAPSPISLLIKILHIIYEREEFRVVVVLCVSFSERPLAYCTFKKTKNNFSKSLDSSALAIWWFGCRLFNHHGQLRARNVQLIICSENAQLFTIKHLATPPLPPEMNYDAIFLQTNCFVS